MRYAIIADIHANQEALEAVLDDIHSVSFDRIICLGDIVGYGANPNEACNLLFKENPICILGNHDYAVLDMNEKDSFSSVAFKSAVWTYNTLDKTYKDIFASFKDKMRLDGFLIAHGALTDRMDYIAYNAVAEDNIDCIKGYENVMICFYGHTHIKNIWYKRTGERVSSLSPDLPLSSKRVSSREYFLEKQLYYLINPGSVGQPRDKDNRASYILFDTDKLAVEYRAISYDIQKAVDKIYKAVGLPNILGDRLRYGV